MSDACCTLHSHRQLLLTCAVHDAVTDVLLHQVSKGGAVGALMQPTVQCKLQVSRECVTADESSDGSSSCPQCWRFRQTIACAHVASLASLLDRFGFDELTIREVRPNVDVTLLQHAAAVHLRGWLTLTHLASERRSIASILLRDL